MPADWAGRVCALLAQTQGPLPKLEQAAQRLNTSGRSLRRHLALQGCSYQQLMDDERKRRALEYLQSGELPLSEIAFQLGFSDLSNFRRAFKKWTGKVPSIFRA